MHVARALDDFVLDDSIADIPSIYGANMAYWRGFKPSFSNAPYKY